MYLGYYHYQTPLHDMYDGDVYTMQEDFLVHFNGHLAWLEFSPIPAHAVEPNEWICSIRVQSVMAEEILFRQKRADWRRGSICLSANVAAVLISE